MVDFDRFAHAHYRVKLKTLTEDELFDEWSKEYDARRDAHVALVIAEMNVRKPGEVIHL